MTRKKEAWVHFKEHVAAPLIAEHVQKLHHYYVQHRDELGEELLEAFRPLWSEIASAQLHGDKGAIGYVICSMLRTSIHLGTYTNRLDAYDGSWFLDTTPCSSLYDTRWVFHHLEKCVSAMHARRPEYQGAVHPQQIEQLALQSASLYHRYVFHLFRKVMPRLIQQEEFIRLRKEEHFEIRVGEYLDISETVYVQEPLPTEKKTVRRWMEQKKERDYVYRSISSADCSQGCYTGMDFRYTHFTKVDFSRSDMGASLWMGIRFEQCNLEAATVRGSILYDAVFSRCNLRGVDFSETLGNQHTWDERLCQFYGIEGVDFSGSDLSRACFRDAGLEGANFIGAQLDGTDFTGAALKGAMFSASAAEYGNWNEQQRKEIEWVSDEPSTS
ncbi:pentapeptide repeat-containing protein [Paenibacillus durus]|uniref:Pentapeptide repeat-containing protein n=1 Tax=Paenibacillus durus ATCC 35681 TaxID=1333534 RepID=A0A0F7CJS7_PAEDU|nr:pentapeptide repeat-containing protein [Paenibacillus durus]AKG36441.1 hypothetical protein VK70_19395 [Paenibacillus durus ATCC 35681]